MVVYMRWSTYGGIHEVEYIVVYMRRSTYGGIHEAEYIWWYTLGELGACT